MLIINAQKGLYKEFTMPVCNNEKAESTWRFINMEILAHLY